MSSDWYLSAEPLIGGLLGMCCNHHCSQFERGVMVSPVVYEAERTRCAECGQLFVHATGLTFRDYLAARAAGEDS